MAKITRTERFEIKDTIKPDKLPYDLEVDLNDKDWIWLRVNYHHGYLSKMDISGSPKEVKGILKKGIEMVEKLETEAKGGEQ